MKAAVQTLNDHPDCIRIQKLLYFTHTQLWIADANILEGMSIGYLLSVLMAELNSIEQLQARLLEDAARLNKSETYIQIAHLIIEALRNNRQDQHPDSSLVVDRFQLRFAIMQVLNPCKAKMILMALYRAPTDPRSPITLSMLDQFSLDELLRRVMQLYPNLKVLEVGLVEIRALISEIDAQEVIQISESLKEVLRPHLSSSPSLPPDPCDADHDPLCTILMGPDLCGELQ